MENVGISHANRPAHTGQLENDAFVFLTVLLVWSALCMFFPFLLYDPDMQLGWTWFSSSSPRLGNTQSNGSKSRNKESLIRRSDAEDQYDSDGPDGSDGPYGDNYNRGKGMQEESREVQKGFNSSKDTLSFAPAAASAAAATAAATAAAAKPVRTFAYFTASQATSGIGRVGRV